MGGVNSCFPRRALTPYHFPTLPPRPFSGSIGPSLWYALCQSVREGRDQEAVAERLGASGGTAREPATNRGYGKSLFAPIRGTCAWSRADVCQWWGHLHGLPSALNGGGRIDCRESRTLMAKSGMAGQGGGSPPTGEKHPRTALLSGARSTHTAPPCGLCRLVRHSPSHPTLNDQLPTRLRVALVDGDERVHDFVRQAFEAHATAGRWTAISLRIPRSVLSAPSLPLRTLHGARLRRAGLFSAPSPRRMHYQLPQP